MSSAFVSSLAVLNSLLRCWYIYAGVKDTETAWTLKRKVLDDGFLGSYLSTIVLAYRSHKIDNGTFSRALYRSLKGNVITMWFA